MKYSIGNGELYQGDCLEVLEDISIFSPLVDLVLCDPPYGITANRWDAAIPFDKMWKALSKVCSEKAVFVFTSFQPFTSFLITSNIKMFRYTWVWEKSTKTNFLNAKKQPLRKHEDIVVFGKKQGVYNPQGVKDKNSFTPQGKTETPNYSACDRKNGGYFQEKTNYPHDIIFFKSNSTSASYHPTQKPVALFEYLIKTYSNPGDTVLDFCIGSGTTAIASEKTNRKWVGIEKERENTAKS